MCHKVFMRETKKTSPFKGETANKITGNILRILALQGWYASRMQSQGQYDPVKGIWRKGTVKRGAPDVIACIKGLFVGIEVKAGNDNMSIWQVETEQEIKRASGVYWVVTSTNDFIQKFETFTKN